MAEQSYKILAAQRLAIDPNALLMYLEFYDHAICTTPDGRQHIFSFAELDHPRNAKKISSSAPSGSINIAETGQKGPGSPSGPDQQLSSKATKIASSPMGKPKSVAKYHGRSKSKA
jgi:hypothetical protein